MARWRTNNFPVKNINFAIEIDLYEQVRDEAYRRHMSLVEFMRELLRNYFNMNDQTAPPAPLAPHEKLYAPTPPPSSKLNDTPVEITTAQLLADPDPDLKAAIDHEVQMGLHKVSVERVFGKQQVTETPATDLLKFAGQDIPKKRDID